MISIKRRVSAFSLEKNCKNCSPHTLLPLPAVGLAPRPPPQSCKSDQAFRVEVGPKVDKNFGLIRAREVFFVLDGQKYNQNNLAALLIFSDVT